MFIVSDFDGTLAEFSVDPDAVAVNRRSIEALTRLSEVHRVAILSGRSLEALRRLLVDAPTSIILAGSHGAETAGVEVSPSEEERQVLEAVGRELGEIAGRFPGAHVEVKPFSRVFHTRPIADTAAAARAADEATALMSSFPGEVKLGKEVVEFSVAAATKGTWISANRLPGEQVVFLGDDVTDEDGFAALLPGDRGVKVGPGDTAASERVADVEAVADFLEGLR